MPTEITCKLCGHTSENTMLGMHLISVTLKSGDVVKWWECDSCRSAKLRAFGPIISKGA